MLLRVPAAAVRAGGAPPPPRAAAAAAAAPPLRAAAGGSRLHCRHAGFASGAPLPASPRRRVRAAAASASRPGVPTSAVLALFSRGPRSVAVPLNLYAALRVSPRAPAGAIDVAAAERAPPPEAAAEALSGEALAARGALLALAGRTLAHAPSRAAYDAALSAGAADVDVPLGSLPGALALLTARAACAAVVCCACVRWMRVRERLPFWPLRAREGCGAGKRALTRCVASALRRRAQEAGDAPTALRLGNAALQARHAHTHHTRTELPSFPPDTTPKTHTRA
jgi:hypothetical protein